jgi:hypothetical protein
MGRENQIGNAHHIGNNNLTTKWTSPTKTGKAKGRQDEMLLDGNA